MNQLAATVPGHRVVSREEWQAARYKLLKKEKEHTRLRDTLSAERRALPWVKVEKRYVFDGPTGLVSLKDLFYGRRQLFVKHFMMGPGQLQQCVGCSLEVDHLAGILIHLEQHGISYAAIARAPIGEIEVVRTKMNWSFPWVSSFHSDFNADFHVSFTPEELEAKRAFYNFTVTDPGLADRSGNSVFAMGDDGEIYHTYSTYGRGGEQFLGVYGYLDVMPMGRGEEGPYHTLADWARPRAMYGTGGMVEPTGRYHASDCACEMHR
jgi:predicted dithiol-disulfide oxidoreductase (DUF899 family)